MTRQRISLRSPGERDLSGFPSTELGPHVRLYRVTEADQKPWWFANDMENRFDLPEPEGTCYLARDEIAALLEVIHGEDDVVTLGLFHKRRIYTLHVPAPRALADCTNRHAVGFGVTAEVHTVTPYDRTQEWAKKLRAAGFDGIAYSVRHDPSPNSDGVALFGKAGERRSWPKGRSQPIGDALRRRLEYECGVEILDDPYTEDLGSPAD